MRKTIIAIGIATLLATGGVAAADHAGTNPTDPGAIGGHPSLYGLCRAYQSGNGGDNGRKNEAPPFAALEEAAGDDSVADFCEGVTPGNGHGNGGNGAGRNG